MTSSTFFLSNFARKLNSVVTGYLYGHVLHVKHKLLSVGSPSTNNIVPSRGQNSMPWVDIFAKLTTTKQQNYTLAQWFLTIPLQSIPFQNLSKYLINAYFVCINYFANNKEDIYSSLDKKFIFICNNTVVVVIIYYIIKNNNFFYFTVLYLLVVVYYFLFIFLFNTTTYYFCSNSPNRLIILVI
jgi:hypothetical protein